MATSAEWAKRVSAWRASGQTAEEFADRRGWNGATLTWWASTLKRRGVSTEEGSSVALHFARVVARPSTVPPSSVSAPASIEVVLSGGRAVRVSKGFAPDVLRAVIETLEGA